MFRHETVLALIPARGGSKGLPGKNVRMLAGRPMIRWSIDAAIRARDVDRVTVSSDDDGILSLVDQAAAGLTLRRPSTLAADETPMADVVLHAIAAAETRPSWLVLLQPTSPLRSAEDIDGAFAVLERTGASSCVSVSLAPKSPYWMYTRIEGDRLAPVLPRDPATRRQALPPAYVLNGAVYIVRIEDFVRDRLFIREDTVAFEMPPERSVDIDTALDLEVAEILMRSA